MVTGEMVAQVTAEVPDTADHVRARYIQMDDAALAQTCLLYTSDAADERSSVDLGGRRIIKKKTHNTHTTHTHTSHYDNLLSTTDHATEEISK